MLNLVGRSAAPSHEDVFIARYAALVRVALNVTDGDRQEAEDLVHEAFIRFTLVQPPLDEVQHLDAYLSRMLRNMYTSRIRRQQRAAETSLSILDYDSLDIASHAIDARALLEVREALRAACDYGRVRRRSSKAGSVFLLRFFHGYLPSEIASLTRLSSAIVDALVFRARREVRAYVEDPRQLASIDGRPAADEASTVRQTRASPEADPSPHALVHELRARIFRDTHDRCWPKKALRDLYRDPSADALTRDVLADLVSCPACLDAANALLGLPRLADRWPADTLGPGTRGGPTGGGVTGSMVSARRRARAVFEHRPRELRVSVNGFVIGAHTIGAHDSDLTLSVNINEPIALVELLSEQGLCLAFLDIAPPPDGNARRRCRIDLSDERYAALEVTFAGPWPTVRASYGDPHWLSTAPTADDHADEQDRAVETQPVRSLSWRLPRVLGLRPATAVLAIVLAWLLFWTPGTTVSAAEMIANTIRWLAGAVFGSRSISTKPAPPEVTARALPPPAPAVRSAAPAALTDSRRTWLELKTLAELQQVEAYLGQEIALAPRAGATVRVQAIVDTGARRDALLDALGPLRADPGLQTRITALDEITSRPRQRPVASAARAFQFAGDDFPMFATVRRYLRHQRQFQRTDRGAMGSDIVDDAALDADTRRFASAVLDRSRRAAQHVWALKHLGDRFPPTRIGHASADAREIWRALIREHARAYQHEMVLLRRDLEPVTRTADANVIRSGADPPAVARPSTLDAWARFTRLLDANRRQERAIQQAFAVQSDASGDGDGVENEAFWALVDLCQALALEIARDPGASLYFDATTDSVIREARPGM
jgi:RNA polymerase sigma factor (sigma-70 family)